MQRLYTQLEQVYKRNEDEEQTRESLKNMRHQLKLQKYYDHKRLKELMPNIDDMGKCLDILYQAKFINHIRLVRYIPK